ncbi:CaiB/BaiF CoA transferase family protein [Streptomyces sp. HB2AG]|uniref:CaiB/BaiF CoA transferase family protein n=1 Tax=Streptomyces sp. HB2AG TaxID=2983400 RepID=UPI0022AA95A9|nr:CaiB/BaiF CoA-transferase family protein [Streptomyces sp. HB2AG]MCZ2528100.1 CaiB/BaiF CoA-transferase family protein [Streptomyces sp. HB2AG]
MGPLAGLTVVEMAGIGPGPFAGMVLADLGADVVRIDRLTPGWGGTPDPAAVRADVVSRGRRSVAVNLKAPEGVELVLDLLAGADALIEGYRPGVMERLGLGPDVCLERNPRLVYGRMTGWGQDGPLADRAGHDINYISLSGALGSVGRAGEPPVPPLNLVGDYGGGGLLLACGMVAALLSVARGGTGQVVDAAMTDGSALLMAQFYGMRAAGLWGGERGTNLLDTGAPFYDVYATADGGHVSVGPIEPAFFAELLDRLGADGADGEAAAGQYDPAAWPALRERLRAAFATRTRDEWEEVFAGSDACVAPVLSMEEAPGHPHNAARGTFVIRDGVVQPAPAPRFSATPAEVRLPPPVVGRHTDEVLAGAGVTPDRLAALRESGVVG